MKTVSHGRLAVFLGAAMLAPMAPAAVPESGTLTLESGPIEYSQGPNVGVNPTPTTTPMCVELALPCDSFALTVDLPENLAEVFPSAVVRMVFDWDDPAGAGVEDYDIYLYDEAGNEINSAATGNRPEVMTILAMGGLTHYTIDAVYFTVVGSTYTGRIELILGEPAEDADVEEFLMNNSILAEALGLNGGEEEPRSASMQRRSGSGALGLGLLLASLGGLILRRRRN